MLRQPESGSGSGREAFFASECHDRLTDGGVWPSGFVSRLGQSVSSGMPKWSFVVTGSEFVGIGVTFAKSVGDKTCKKEKSRYRL